MAATREAVLEALKGVTDPVSGSDIVGAGVVRALNVGGDGAVRFVMEIAPSQAKAYEAVKDEAEKALAGVEGVGTVSIVLTGHTEKAPPPDLKPQRQAEPQGPQPVPGVTHIIAVASGKGGVGKSTVSANLACALAQQGRRVGLLDADVYGPSQPRMLGVSGRPASPDGKTILPMRNHGVTMMSIGLMTNEDQAVVWRGPMLMGALQQMMNQVQWGALDFRRSSAWHWLRADDPDPKVPDRWRCCGQHPAGCCVARCAQGHRHVPAAQGADPRNDRKHEHTHLFAMRTRRTCVWSRWCRSRSCQAGCSFAGGSTPASGHSSGCRWRCTSGCDPTR